MTSRWVHVPVARPAARLRLFCFPCAGGTAANYHSWPAQLPADIEVCAVELPGRRARLVEPLLNRMDALVDQLQLALRPLFDRPSAFFGHSMGGLLAFELVRRLRSVGSKLPERLIVSGCRAPHIAKREPDMHTLPDSGFLSEIRKLNGIEAEVFQNPEFVALVLPMLRADCELTETWRYVIQDPLNLPIDAYGGLDDSQVTSEDLDGWGLHTTGPFRSKRYAGDHFYLVPSKDELLRDISRSLRTFG